MKDFLDELDAVLRVEAARAAEAPAPAPARRGAPRWRRPAILTTATAAVAAAVTSVALTGTSLAELPILGTPTTDASAVESRAPQARRAGVDFAEGHPFATPSGPGFVLSAGGEDPQLCLVVPDEGSYPGSCVAQSRAEREGLAFEVVGDRTVSPGARTLYAYVLPADARGAELVDAGGRARRAAVESGVVAGTTDRDVTLRWTVDGRPAQREIRGPFDAASTLTITCPGGREVTVPVDQALATGDTSGRIAPARRAELCR